MRLHQTVRLYKQMARRPVAAVRDCFSIAPGLRLTFEKD